MEIVLNILLLIGGFVALIKGADIFVDGSSSLAAIFRVPTVIIGLTIVALGTSAPELAVSTSAALNSSNEIAFSNVVGSNSFNILMVLGVCAVIKPVPIVRAIRKRDYPISIVATAVLFCVLLYGMIDNVDFSKVKMTDNVTEVTRPIGIGMIVAFLIYIGILIYFAVKHKVVEEDLTKKMSPFKSVLFIVLGVALIIAGGQFVVNSAEFIAEALGMSETLIGLTVVAFGTSLPELVTSIVASRKGENGLAVGNVVGSNIFNLLFILGVSSAVHPIPVQLSGMIDLAIVLGVSIMVYVFALTNKIRRYEGIIMILTYAAIIVFAALR